MKKSISQEKIRIIQWGVMFVISIACIFLAYHFHNKLASFRSLGLLGIFLINFFSSATLFVPAPGIVSVVAGGIVYSPVLVGFVATLGAVLGDMIAYVLGLSTEHVFWSEKDGYYTIIKDLFKKYGGLIVFLFAFIPNPFFDLVGIMAGVLSYSWYKFALWLFLGRLVRNILLAFIGAQF